MAPSKWGLQLTDRYLWVLLHCKCSLYQPKAEQILKEKLHMCKLILEETLLSVIFVSISDLVYKRKPVACNCDGMFCEGHNCFCQQESCLPVQNMHKGQMEAIYKMQVIGLQEVFFLFHNKVLRGGKQL